MASGKAKRHTHKYRLVPMGSGKVWACALSDCNHYMPPNMAHMIEGKASICWECGNTLILSVARMQSAIDENEGRAICDRCLNLRHGIEIPEDKDEIDFFIKKVIGGDK